MITDFWCFSAGSKSSGSGSDTYWSASAQQSSAASPSVPIDWSAIRENREKYETLKWQGERVSTELY